ncbi:MAG: hydroxymethylpyrimidine/phosphomethylpyrimidine kinase [Nitrospirae bacterium]|nr:hydroxymethylpyrimidine/phosphomethylpyrimidine kinase [Nitrospirota bacterium]
MSGDPWSLAGIDPSGGAGIFQDLRVFQSLGFRGRGIPTCLTVQNLDGVRGVEPVGEKIFSAMVETLAQESLPASLKIGLLPVSLCGILEDFLAALPSGTPVILDPVYRFGSGGGMTSPEEYRLLARTLFSRVSLVTPNLPEAQELAGWSLERYPDDLSLMARRIHEKYGAPAVLLKGGHFLGEGPKVDLFWTPLEEKYYSHPPKTIGGVHGGGCTLSALVAGLSLKQNGAPLEPVVSRALDLYQRLLGEVRGTERGVLDPELIRPGRPEGPSLP